MLEDIPEEVLTTIVSCLAVPNGPLIAEDPYRRPDIKRYPLGWNGQPLTLSQLCLTSKKLRRIAEPVLYRTFPSIYLGKLRWFLRSIIARPYLATFVEEVCFEDFDTRAHYEDSDRDPMPMPEEFGCFFKQAMMSLQPPSDLATEWASVFDEGIEDAEVALLVSLCPNLGMIDFTLPWVLEDSILYKVVMQRCLAISAGSLQPASLIGQRLSRLREVNIRGFDCNCFSSDDFFCFMRLPTLDTFRLPYYLDCNRPGPMQMSHSIKHISFVDCWLSSSNLCAQLRTWPNLESLELHWAEGHPYRSQEDIRVQTLDFTAIGECLRLNNTQLKRLKIDPVEPHNIGMRRFHGKLGSLVELDKLRNLAIPDTEIFGIGGLATDDALPHSLTELNILPTFWNPDGPNDCKNYEIESLQETWRQRGSSLGVRVICTRQNGKPW